MIETKDLSDLGHAPEVFVRIDQFVVGTAGLDFAIAQKVESVAIANGRKPVRDDNEGTSIFEGFKGLHHQALRLIVKR